MDSVWHGKTQFIGILQAILLDMTIPTNMPASATLSTNPVISPTYTPTKALTGPITRSRAKKIQQKVHKLLYKFQLNTNENFMLPKSCMLMLLRYTKNTLRTTQKEESRLSPPIMTEPSKINSHIFWFSKAMRAHKHLLKIYWSRVSQARLNWIFKYGAQPILLLTGQKVNSLLDYQVFVLNCIILWSFIIHAIHGSKVYQVSFSTHLASRHLEIPRWSYYQNSKDCVEVKQPPELRRSPRRGPSH
jgi:hypothetical protein